MKTAQPLQSPQLTLLGIVRVSTAEQAGSDRAGLERQRASLRAIAAREGATLDIVEIVDVSGSDVADTPQWREVVRRLEAGDVHLAVDAVDRIIRADSFDFRVLADVQRTRTRLYTPTGTQDLSNPTHVLMSGLMGLLGGYEKREIVRRAQAAKEAKRRNGEWVSRLDATPMGTVYDRRSKKWSYNDEAWRVREMFRALADDGVSLAEAARSVGVSGAAIRVLVSNTIYKGVLTFDQRRGEKYASSNGKQAHRRKVARKAEDVIKVRVFPPEDQLVSDDLWTRANRRVEERRRSGSKRRMETGKEIPYSGFLVSDLEPTGPYSEGFYNPDMSKPHRHVVYGRSGGKTKITSYQCRCMRGKLEGPKCGLPGLQAHLLNRALDALFVRLTSDSTFVQRVLDHLRGREVRDPRDEIRSSLQAAGRKLSKLVDLHLDGAIDRATYDSKRTALQTDQERLQARLDAAAESQSLPTAEAISEALRGFKFDPSWDPAEKRLWLSRNVGPIRISREGIEALTIRLPGDMPSFRAVGPVTWEELVGFDISDRSAVLASEGRFTISKVCEVIGLSEERFRYLVKRGSLPESDGRVGLHRWWSPETVRTIRLHAARVNANVDRRKQRGD